jgi:hypothetical protein
VELLSLSFWVVEMSFWKRVEDEELETGCLDLVKIVLTINTGINCTSIEVVDIFFPQN